MMTMLNQACRVGGSVPLLIMMRNFRGFRLHLAEKVHNHALSKGGERKGTPLSTEEECYSPMMASSSFNTFTCTTAINKLLSEV